MKNCYWRGSETGYYLQQTVRGVDGNGGYNELIVDAHNWPDNIVEASFGDAQLPPPHVYFDPSDWTNPFH